MSSGYALEIFETESEKRPFEDWFKELSAKPKAAVAARLARLKAGNLGDVKHLGDGLFEMRVHLSPGFRIYFGMQGNAIVILLCGGDKSTQKRDIKKAREYLDQWEGT